MPEALTKKQGGASWEKIFCGAFQSPEVSMATRPECLRSASAIVLAWEFRLVWLT